MKNSHSSDNDVPRNLRNAWRTVGQLEPHFRGQGAKMSNRLHKRKWSTWIAVSNTVNNFRIGWTVIEKSQPEHDQQFTRLYDLLPTGSSLWCNFRSTCKDCRGQLRGNFEVASSNSFRDIKKHHFVTAAAESAADMDDSIKWKRFRVSLKKSLLIWRLFYLQT